MLHATVRRSRTGFDSRRGHFHDAGARRNGGCLQGTCEWACLRRGQANGRRRLNAEEYICYNRAEA